MPLHKTTKFINKTQSVSVAVAVAVSVSVAVVVVNSTHFVSQCHYLLAQHCTASAQPSCFMSLSVTVCLCVTLTVCLSGWPA